MPRWTPSKRRLVESPQTDEILRLNGLNNLDDVFRIAARASSRHNGRGVCPVWLLDVNGGRFTAYFKLNWGLPRLNPQWEDVKSGRVFQSLVYREWLGIERMERLGFRVPRRLAFFEDGWIRRRSAVIIRAVPPRESLSEMIRSASWTARPAAEQDGLIEAGLATLRRIDAHGLAWRGALTRHLFPEKNAHGEWAMWLIDCEGIHDRTSETLARDIARFQKSLQTDHAKRSQKLGVGDRPATSGRAAA